MQSTGTRPSRDAAADSGPGLDPHASAALDRLTRWAAKALRAAVAIVVLGDGERLDVASVTDLGAARASGRLREVAAQIARSGLPQAIDETEDEAGCAVLGAPLCDRDRRPIGSFCVMDTRPRRWTTQDVELVNELSSSATTELDLLAARAAAAREQRWSDHQQAVLELIAARAPLARTLSELLRGAETHAPGMLASISRLDAVRGRPDRLTLIAGHGLPRGFASALDGVAVAEGGSISATAASRREPVVVADVAGAGLSPWFVELAARHGLRAGWATPILAGSGRALGAFTIYYRTARTPDERDRVVVDRSVHLARLAIEQADGARALRRTASRAQSLAREQTALQRVATGVAGETDGELHLSLVAEQLGLLLKADAGYVLRFEEAHSYRSMGAWARNGGPLLAPGAVAEHPPGGAFAALRTSRGARRHSLDPARDALAVRHRIAAPVVVDGRCWGVVVALRDAREFRREDGTRLARFAQLASVAVANADAREALATQARSDPLTGLANRRAFDERLVHEAGRANRHDRALSVMLVDVDHFKTINDRFGHGTGDRVLVALADSLRTVMRNDDLLARIGGDEMAMILPDCPTDQAALVAQRMLDAIRTSSLARRHGVTLSAGVAGLAPGQSADDLLRRADQALYGAKDGGRNRVVLYEVDMPDRSGLQLGA